MQGIPYKISKIHYSTDPGEQAKCYWAEAPAWGPVRKVSGAEAQTTIRDPRSEGDSYHERRTTNRPVVRLRKTRFGECFAARYKLVQAASDAAMADPTLLDGDLGAAVYKDDESSQERVDETEMSCSSFDSIASVCGSP